MLFSLSMPHVWNPARLFAWGLCFALSFNVGSPLSPCALLAQRNYGMLISRLLGVKCACVPGYCYERVDGGSVSWRYPVPRPVGNDMSASDEFQRWSTSAP